MSIPGFKLARSKGGWSDVYFDTPENAERFVERVRNLGDRLSSYVSLSQMSPQSPLMHGCVLYSVNGLSVSPYRFVTDLLRQQEAERSKAAKEPIYEYHV